MNPIKKSIYQYIYSHEPKDDGYGTPYQPQYDIEREALEELENENAIYEINSCEYRIVRDY